MAVNKIANMNEIKGVTFTALATTNKTFELKGNDLKTMLLIENTATANGTVTIGAGTSAHACGELVLTAPVGVSVVCIDSAKYKNVNNGTIAIKGSATTLSVAVVERP